MLNFRHRAILAVIFLAGICVAAPAQKLTGAAALQSNRVADTVNVAARTPLAGHIPTWATPAADTGAVATDTPQLLTFDVARSPEVQAAFDQLLADQQNPASARYHQWLTPQQIGEQYGPTQHDLDAFTGWLTAQGFTVANITPSRVFIQATAPASVVTNALGTQLHTFAVGSAKLQAPLTEPSFPSTLAPVVKFVSGLTTVQYHSFSTTLPPVPISVLGSTADGTTHTDYTLSSGTHFLAPADFNLIYNVTPTIAAGITGTGQRVAVIGGSRLLASDVTSWESISALTAYQPTYYVPTGLTDPGTTSDGNQGEATLDFERVYGTAPGAGVDLVISKNALTTDTDTLQLYAINTLNDAVMTMSYGACETGYGSYAAHENSLFAQAIAQGISIFASSGDTGVAGCEAQGTPPATQIASVQIPCDSVYLTCVGGTQFSDTANPSTYWSATNGTGKLSALSYIPEGGWNEPTATSKTGATITNVDASTGGPSLYIPKPTWQTGSGVPTDGVRDVPDISFSASGHNAYFSCLAYQGADCTTYITGFGGTSASAPSMAGLAALINQKLGKRQGLLNPLLYSTAVSTPSAFHDATPATSGVATCTTAVPSTCNNSTPSPTAQTGGLAGYPLLTGYDFPTGLGSLDFGKFLTAISLPTPTITLTATPATITISQTVKFTATLTSASGTPTGTVQFYSRNPQLSTDRVALGTPVALVGGVATTPALSFAPAATYNITAAYTGDTAFSPATSTALTFVVTNPNAVASASALMVTPAPATTLQPITLTATVKAAAGTVVPTGTVQFYDATVPTGNPVALSATGVASLNLNYLAAGTHTLTCLYSGDATFAASTCSAVSDVVTAVPSTTVETLSASSITGAGSTTLSYTVTSSAGGIPTGTITAYAAQTAPVVVAAQSLGSVSLYNGAASGTLTGLTPGTYSLYGVYGGDINYAGSTSQSLTLNVSGFTIAVTPTLSLSAGAASGNTVTVTYGSVGGFASSIGQTCTIAPSSVAAVPIGPTCSFSPATVTLAAGGTATSTVIIGSTAAGTGVGLQIGALRTGVIGGVSLAGLFLLMLPTRRRMLRNWRALAMLLVATAALFTASGCGSGGTNASTGGTTKATYLLTVTSTGSGQTSVATSTITIK